MQDPVLIALVAVAVSAAVFFFARSRSGGRKETKKEEVFLKSNAQVLHLTLSEKHYVSHDTRRFRFALPDPNMRLGLPVGKHFTLYAPNRVGVSPGQWNGREDMEASKEKIERKYTPTTSDDVRGYFDLIVKVYQPNERFSDGGKMSQHLDSLVPGKDQIELRGPFGLIEYVGRGVFEQARKRLPLKKHIGMLAGGTGITPMLQIIAAILKDPEDESQISLIFANQTENDILVREELETLARKHPNRFQLHLTLDRPPANWSQESGFITEEMIRKYIAPPAEDSVVLICGPPPMVKFACQDNLNKIGYSLQQQLVF